VSSPAFSLPLKLHWEGFGLPQVLAIAVKWLHSPDLPPPPVPAAGFSSCSWLLAENHSFMLWDSCLGGKCFFGCGQRPGSTCSGFGELLDFPQLDRSAAL